MGPHRPALDLGEAAGSPAALLATRIGKASAMLQARQLGSPGRCRLPPESDPRQAVLMWVLALHQVQPPPPPPQPQAAPLDNRRPVPPRTVASGRAAGSTSGHSCLSPKMDSAKTSLSIAAIEPRPSCILERHVAGAAEAASGHQLPLPSWALGAATRLMWCSSNVPAPSLALRLSPSSSRRRTRLWYRLRMHEGLSMPARSLRGGSVCSCVGSCFPKPLYN
mmetsp:Transcript_11241/g.25879  ORF Transcript_11241/g.25879 Transcript_11241/m.25879 type:complete len:222 (-) Transcript_11241:126-791(-)